MNPLLIHKKPVTFIGYAEPVTHEEAEQKCPEIWEKNYNQRFEHLWETGKPENPVEEAILAHNIGRYALCLCNGNGFDYMIAGEYKGGEVPQGLSLYTFPESDWLTVMAKGALPESLQTVNTAFWQEWVPENKDNFTFRGNHCVEYYPEGDTHSPDYKCSLWAPILLPEEESEDKQ